MSQFIAVLGLVLLLLAACNVPSPPRISLGWAGLFFWFLAAFLGTLAR